jgi:hypothetical protein
MLVSSLLRHPLVCGTEETSFVSASSATNHKPFFDAENKNFHLSVKRINSHEKILAWKNMLLTIHYPDSYHLFPK